MTSFQASYSFLGDINKFAGENLDILSDTFGPSIGCQRFEFKADLMGVMMGAINGVVGAFGDISNAPQTIGEHLLSDTETVVCMENLIRLGVAGTVTLGLSLIPQLIALGQASTEAAYSMNICLDDFENERHPTAYTNQQIIRLLKEGGVPPSVENVVDKYQKLCIKHKNQISWWKNGDCRDMKVSYVSDNAGGGLGSFLGGIADFALGTDDAGYTCVSNLSGYQYVLCARVIGGCPCINNVQKGTIGSPEYEKSDNGSIRFDDNGNPIIKNREEFMSSFAKHCRIIRAPFLDDLDAKIYSGIIDETCYSLTGYAKHKIPVSSGLVQCLVNTSRNIFEKPIFIRDFNDRLSEKQKEKIKMFENDAKLIRQTHEEIIEYIVLESTNGKSVKDIVAEVTTKINQMRNGGKIKSLTIDQIPESPEDIYIFANATNIFKNSQATIDGIKTSINKYFTQCEEKIFNTKRIYVLSVFNAQQNEVNPSKDGKTMFQKFQSYIKLIGIIVMILFFFDYGYQALTGGIKMDLKSNALKMLDLGIVYYVVFSTGWQDLFLDVLFSASGGFANIMFQAGTAAQNPKFKYCDYSINQNVTKVSVEAVSGGAYDITTNVDKCSASNTICHETSGTRCVKGTCMQCGDGSMFNCAQYDHTGFCRYGSCIHKQYINRPNYERPYIPYYYPRYTNTNVGIDTMLKVKCRQGNTIEDATLTNGLLICSDGFQMDNGYTVKALMDADLLDEFEKNQLNMQYDDILKTADYVYSANGIIEKVPINGLDAQFRQTFVSYVENNRHKKNRNRSYPVIQTPTGSKRDMSYLAAFDTIDCRLQAYMGLGLVGIFGDQNYNELGFSEEGVIFIFKMLMGAIFMIFSHFGLGIVLFLLVFTVVAMMSTLVARIVISYAVSMVMLVCLCYISPVFFLMKLFPKTKSFYDKWEQNVKAYTLTPAIGFFVISFFMFFFDLIMFGNPAKYHKMFDSAGHILSNCYEGDLNNAPIMCLFTLFNKYNTTEFLGISIKYPSYDLSFDALGLMVFKMLQAVIIISLTIGVFDGLEGEMSSIFGFGAADTNIGQAGSKMSDTMQDVMGGIKSAFAKRPKKKKKKDKKED